MIRLVMARPRSPLRVRSVVGKALFIGVSLWPRRQTGVARAVAASE